MDSEGHLSFLRKSIKFLYDFVIIRAQNMLEVYLGFLPSSVTGNVSGGWREVPEASSSGEPGDSTG